MSTPVERGVAGSPLCLSHMHAGMNRFSHPLLPIHRQPRLWRFFTFHTFSHPAAADPPPTSLVEVFYISHFFTTCCCRSTANLACGGFSHFTLFHTLLLPIHRQPRLYASPTPLVPPPPSTKWTPLPPPFLLSPSSSSHRTKCMALGCDELNRSIEALEPPQQPQRPQV